MFKWVMSALTPTLRSFLATTKIRQQQQYQQQQQQRLRLLSSTTTTTTARTTTRKATTATRATATATATARAAQAATIVNFTLTTLIISALFVQTTSGFRSVETNGSGGRKLFGGYRITPKHCRATKTLSATDPRANGPTICMFNHECAQRGGEVVGACMDGFLFGACCQIPNTHELASTLINDAQNAYYHQHQQQKLQLQQSITNPAAAQSYETYGESQQHSQESQSQETKYQPVSSDTYQTPQTDSYTQQNIDKVFQQLESSSSGYGVPPVAISQSTQTNSYAGTSEDSAPADDGYAQQQQAQLHTTSGQQEESSQQEDAHIASSSTEATHSGSSEFENEALMQAENEASFTNNLNHVQPPNPTAAYVNKHKVKLPTSPTPPQNDDFVMHVLSTLTPEQTKEHLIFTTEIPNKITSNIADQSSSESSSFEEVQAPTQATKPHKPAHKPTQSVKHKPAGEQKPQHVNIHHHNHLVLDGTAAFTHSDITHPGADADLVEEDLQFSTGYGPQPVYISPPKETASTAGANYASVPATATAGSAEDKYVLVQTINHEKRPSTVGDPTTSSSITTHVDSIESIILQLNNTNHGPTYNVVNHQTPSYAAQSAPQNAYNDATTTTRPELPAPTSLPATFYQEVETKHPDEYYSQEQQTAEQSNYAITTSATKVSEEQASSEYQPLKPVEHSTSHPSYAQDTSADLEDHTMPASGYNDISASAAPQTSSFNKMPAVGIAYPVDMSYPEEEQNVGVEVDEPTSYTQDTSESSTQSSTENNYQKISTPTEQAHLVPAYNRPTTNSGSHSRPVASYIGMVTLQSYNQQSQTPTYEQLPDEVSVSSHTTKVQEEYDSPAAYQTDKLASSTPISTYGKPTHTVNLYPSPSPSLAQQAQYDAAMSDTSSTRPLLVTASPRPRPKPSTTRPIKHPASTHKTSKPQLNKHTTNQGTTSYDQPPPHPAFTFSQLEASTRRPALPAANTYQDDEYTAELSQTKQPQAQTAPIYNKEEDSTQASSSYAQQTTFNKQPVAQSTHTYEAPETAGSSYEQAAPSYNQEPQPGTKQPAATSYISSPSTSRPAGTIDYHYDKVPPLIIADDKLDAFIQSTAENIIGSTPSNYQPPVYVTSATPVQVQRPQDNYNSNSNNNKHKKPGFVKVNPTGKPASTTVYNTPRPTVFNIVTSSTWTQVPGGNTKLGYNPTTPTSTYSSSSYVHSPTITKRPGIAVSASDYGNIAPVINNDFEDPGYFSAQKPAVHPAFAQSTTETLFAVPSDDKPAFPGYYGPTPSYPAFSVPGEKFGSNAEEETYTSPNDFVNFPPVRNPNLNMSAVSSAVTSDLELSTPAFVEDTVLKDKMNTLVHKLVASLQGNFDALADMIDESNNTVASYQAESAAGSSTTGTRKPTRKPTRIGSTNKPKSTTKKPVTRVSTKAPTRKTTVSTRKPVTRRTTVPATTTTRKPSSRKPTRRIVTTSTTASSARPATDEIVDEEDEEDVNPSDNEIDQGATLSSYGAGGRKIQCGVRPHVKSGRIVGGKGSTFGAYPWQVLVRESTWLGLFTKNKCGGVLITSRYVITAAHCQPGFLASLVAVLGEFDISGDLESKRPVTKNVKRVIVHRQYDPATFENDLALLELESPVQFDTHIVPICMPSDTADFTGRMATVTGWGRLKYGGGVPSVLQEVQVPVIENSVCQEMFITAGHNKRILNSFLCAGYANGQKDSCEGDSGGPLVLQRPDGRYELAGTVSHGIKCAAPYLPGVYMRTTFYKPWLRSITGVK